MFMWLQEDASIYNFDLQRNYSSHCPFNVK
jgi:hypothetical protein